MATTYANNSVLYPISDTYCMRFLITELLEERTVKVIPPFLAFPIIFITGIYSSVPFRD